MGIKGLKQFIKKHAPSAITTVHVNTLKGSTICIDSSILMYRFRYQNSSDDFHITGFKNKINELNALGVKCIFVFDGKQPDAKNETIKKRNETRDKMTLRLNTLKENYNPEFIDSDGETDNNDEILSEINKLEKNITIVTKKHFQEVKLLLKNKDIQFIEAPDEAEKYCAFLQKKGLADYILTEDTDSLTFGGSNILFSSKKRGYFELASLETILSSLGITYDIFVDFCILSGCDYTGTIPKVGPVTALKNLKKYNSIENFKLIPENFNYQLARNLFKIDNYPLPVINFKSSFLFV